MNEDNLSALDILFNSWCENQTMTIEEKEALNEIKKVINDEDTMNKIFYYILVAQKVAFKGGAKTTYQFIKEVSED